MRMSSWSIDRGKHVPIAYNVTGRTRYRDEKRPPSGAADVFQ
jgi:hypothetical protein